MGVVTPSRIMVQPLPLCRVAGRPSACGAPLSGRWSSVTMFRMVTSAAAQRVSVRPDTAYTSTLATVMVRPGRRTWPWATSSSPRASARNLTARRPTRRRRGRTKAERPSRRPLSRTRRRRRSPPARDGRRHGIRTARTTRRPPRRRSHGVALQPVAPLGGTGEVGTERRGDDCRAARGRPLDRVAHDRVGHGHHRPAWRKPRALVWRSSTRSRTVDGSSARSYSGPMRSRYRLGR